MKRAAERAVAIVVGLSAVVLGCTEAATREPPRLNVDVGGAPGAFAPYQPPIVTAPPAGASGAGGTGGASGAGAGGMVATSGAGGKASGAGAVLLGFIPTAISDDGQVVIGVSEEAPARAARWSAHEGGRILSPGAIQGQPEVAALSANGEISVGFTVETVSGRPFATVWNGFQPDYFPSVPMGTRDMTAAVGISQDGHIIIGTASNSGDVSGASVATVVWTNLDWAIVGALPGDSGSEPTVMNRTGTAIAGFSYAGTKEARRAFLFRADTGVTELQPPSSAERIVPRVIADSGDLVFADRFSGPTESPQTRLDALVWDHGAPVKLPRCPSEGTSRVVALAAKTPLLLGACSNAFDDADATDETPFVVDLASSPMTLTMLPRATAIDRATPVGISADASVIAGLGRGAAREPIIQLWVARGAPIPTNVSVPDLGGAAPRDIDVAAISDDGSTIVGSAADANGVRRGWLIHLR
ncbi:MAG TPA: hypothetical protein VHJ20_14520 [Polyangia bacterium]|nr:hypothetical protein [Polyangia bacterium]